jgi:hypothetical protein
MMRGQLELAALVASCLVGTAARADDAACIAASEQALSLRKEGKLHDELKQLAVCAEASCPAEVVAECARRIADVDAAMPTLILGAKDGAGNDLSAVTVSMDGAVLVRSLDGRPIAIDPGAHLFRFETPGQPPLEKTLVLREREKDRRENVVVGAPPVAAPPAATVTVGSAAPPPPSHVSPRKTLALVSGGLGVAGVALGAVFGAFASSIQSREKRDCSESACSSRPQAVADYDAATKDATGSTIAFAAGGVFLAGAVALWLTAPADAAPPTGAGAALPPVGRVRVVPGFTANGGRMAIEGSF